METRVTITGIDIPFLQMVGLIIKWSLAAIPAMIIISILFTIVGVILTVIFGSIFAGLFDRIPNMILPLIF